jgi:hypothetical protein
MTPHDIAHRMRHPEDLTDAEMPRITCTAMVPVSKAAVSQSRLVQARALLAEADWDVMRAWPTDQRLAFAEELRLWARLAEGRRPRPIEGGVLVELRDGRGGR